MVYHWPFTVKAGYTSPFFWLFQRKKHTLRLRPLINWGWGLSILKGFSMKLYGHFILRKTHLTSLLSVRVCMFKLPDLCSVLFVCTAVNYLSRRLDLSTNKYNKKQILIWASRYFIRKGTEIYINSPDPMRLIHRDTQEISMDANQSLRFTIASIKLKVLIAKR